MVTAPRQHLSIDCLGFLSPAGLVQRQALTHRVVQTATRWLAAACTVLPGSSPQCPAYGNLPSRYQTLIGRRPSTSSVQGEMPDLEPPPRWMAPLLWSRCDSTPSNRQNAVVNSNNLEGTIGLSAHAAERLVDCILRIVSGNNDTDKFAYSSTASTVATKSSSERSPRISMRGRSMRSQSRSAGPCLAPKPIR